MSLNQVRLKILSKYFINPNFPKLTKGEKFDTLQHYNESTVSLVYIRWFWDCI